MTTDNYPCQKHDEEAHYYFVLNDFINLIKTYGAAQVVHDLYLADQEVFTALDKLMAS